jgi:hypothetical protein
MSRTVIQGTRHGSTASRVRAALADALRVELSLDESDTARQAFVGAQMGDRVVEYGEAADELLDELADRCVMQIRPLQQARDKLHQEAADWERRRFDKLPRRDHLNYGPVPVE